MGEEYGERNPFHYFISHTDKTLVEMIHKGRKEEFAHFNWKGKLPDAQSEEVFYQSTLAWTYESDEDSARLLSFYKWLIAFRKQRTAMQGRSRGTVHVFDATDNKVIAYERRFDGDYLLILLNFNKKEVGYSLPASESLRKIFDSSTADGKVAEDPTIITGFIKLAPLSAHIFEIGK
jgi:maltooligosyltrehalose trehalohydrolase